MRKLIFFPALLLAAIILPALCIAQSGGANPALVMYRYNGSAGISPLPVVQGNLIGTIRWDGLTAIGSIRSGASIQSYVTGPVSPGVLYANMVFRTGAPDQQNRMVITSDGLVGIGTMTPAYHLDVVGNTHTSGDFFGRIHFDNNAGTNDAPNTYIDEAYFELKNRAILTGGLALPPSGNAQGGLFSLAPGGSSLDHQLFFGDDGIWTRRKTGNAADWTGADWQKVLTGEFISGTPNRIAKFTAPNSLGDSRLFDNGVRVGINNFAPAFDLDITGTTHVSADALVGGNLGVGTNTPAFKLQVVGDGYVNGRMAIGPTPHFATGFALSVNGKIITDELLVQLESAWADYVFEKDYRLTTLAETEKYVRENKHLPGIASAAEVAEKGLNVGEMQKAQMEKIEELYLHLIDLEKRLGALENQNKQLQLENASLKSAAAKN